MDNKFQSKYKISSARLQNWDYSSEEAYFITICTKDKVHYFGKIEDETMILSNVGVIADLIWHEIKNHTKNAELGEFVVMPDHIHGILILKDGEIPNHLTASNGNLQAVVEATLHADVETLHATSLHSQLISSVQQPKGKNEQMAKISPKMNTITTIIRSYKSAVTKHCNRLNFDFSWQPRFHDHIIRDAKSFDNIQNNIANNPAQLKKNEFGNFINLVQ